MRSFFILFLSFALLLASSSEKARVQFLASKVERSGSIVTAEGSVIVYYKDLILQAERVVYDIDRSVMDLFGNVSLTKGTEYALLSDHVHLDLKNERDLFSDYFLTGFETQLWAKGKKAERIDKKLELEKAFISSCDVECPDWHIEFSSVEYNLTTKWMDIWNPTFYIRKTPVFYLPYIGTSMEKKRKSGLLRPSFGVSDRDGFIFDQPLYLAPDPQWDLQITPQYRVDRGAGIYTTFRFVDTPDSGGYVKAGYFRTKQSYVEDYDLKNRSHYGMELKYERPKVFTSAYGDDTDGLYVDITYLNDPDYINLQATTTAELADSSQVQSRVNYYYNTQNNYAGVYGKYFIDTSLSDGERRETFQNVPIIQLHHYQNRLFGWNALQYSADYRFNNYFTESGKSIQFQEVNLPLTFYTSFFDDYFKFSVSENLYYSYSAYRHMDETLKANGVESDYYSLFRNYHTLDFYSDLARSYGKEFHTMQLRVTYNKPSFSSEKGDTIEEISVLRSPRENLNMSVINYLYGAEGEEYLYYRITQPILYEPLEEADLAFKRYGDLEQEIRMKFMKHYEFYTDLFFSYYLHSVSAATSYIKYSKSLYDIMLNHFYKETLKDGRTSDFFSMNGTYRSEAGNDWYANVAYDNLNEKVSRWGVGIHFFRNCWDLDIGVRDEIKPILTSAEEADSIHNVTLYFKINLVPFGEYQHAFEQEL
ncbi:LPS-assembly protein LptD [Hydrogenimonas sp.]